MSENTALRFHLVDVLLRLPYGRSRKIDGSKVRAAWPPTGDHAPNTVETLFRALALAGSGNRPEASYTTDERIERDLDGSFAWYMRPEDGDYVFHRKDSACPKCRGRMTVPKREVIRLSDVLKDESPAAMAFTESWENCDMHGKDSDHD